MKSPASLGLRALNAALRAVVKPRLARTPAPTDLRKDFARIARWLFRRPPYLLRRVSPGAPDLHWITAGPVTARGVILYLHGGAYIAGSPATHEGLAGRLSRLTRLRVAAPRYRLAPEHPAPAAFEDALAAWGRLRALGYLPEEIVLAGDSAGGGLALALLSALLAKGDRPAGLVAFSAWADLSLGSQSLATNAQADPMLPVGRIEEVVGYVVGELRPEDPRLSPLHAPFANPPPVLMLVGDTEILRDDTLRMAAWLRRAGGSVQVSQWEAVPHAWPLFDGWVPEARAALKEAAAFIGALMPPDRR